MDPYGSRWLQMATDGSRWLQMAPDGSVWLQTGCYGSIWLKMAHKAPKGADGWIWLYIARIGPQSYLWLNMAYISLKYGFI